MASELGTIKSVKADRGFGFIRRTDRCKRDAYFHESDILDESIDFDEAHAGREVRYEVGYAASGPRARRVELID